MLLLLIQHKYIIFLVDNELSYIYIYIYDFLEHVTFDIFSLNIENVG